MSLFQSRRRNVGIALIATMGFAHVALAQGLGCAQAGDDWVVCPRLPSESPSCPNGRGNCYSPRPWNPKTYPVKSWLPPDGHGNFKFDESSLVPWVGSRAEGAALITSGKYRVVHYDLNPGHAAGISFGRGSEWAPTPFTQAPIELSDNESVYKVAVYIPDNAWGGSDGSFTGLQDINKTQQIYIPQVEEVNAVDQQGKIVHYVQFRGFNGTNKGHYIYVDVFIQKSNPVFRKEVRRESVRHRNMPSESKQLRSRKPSRLSGWKAQSCMRDRRS